MRVENGFYVPREFFKDIAGYEGEYQVSNRGRVVSRKSGERIELSPVGDGRYVNLSKGGRMEKASIAYLVARAFLPNMERRPYVRHKDGDSGNNRAENLEWVEERVRGPRKGGESPNAPKKVIACGDGGEVLSFGSVSEAAEATGVARAGIIRCLNGKQKTAGGYIWRQL